MTTEKIVKNISYHKSRARSSTTSNITKQHARNFYPSKINLPSSNNTEELNNKLNEN